MGWKGGEEIIEDFRVKKGEGKKKGSMEGLRGVSL